MKYWYNLKIKTDTSRTFYSLRNPLALRMVRSNIGNRKIVLITTLLTMTNISRADLALGRTRCGCSIAKGSSGHPSLQMGKHGAGRWPPVVVAAKGLTPCRITLGHQLSAPPQGARQGRAACPVGLSPSQPASQWTCPSASEGTESQGLGWPRTPRVAEVNSTWASSTKPLP